MLDSINCYLKDEIPEKVTIILYSSFQIKARGEISFHIYVFAQFLEFSPLHAVDKSLMRWVPDLPTVGRLAPPHRTLPGYASCDGEPERAKPPGQLQLCIEDIERRYSDLLNNIHASEERQGIRRGLNGIPGRNASPATGHPPGSLLVATAPNAEGHRILSNPQAPVFSVRSRQGF